MKRMAVKRNTLIKEQNRRDSWIRGIFLILVITLFIYLIGI